MKARVVIVAVACVCALAPVVSLAQSCMVSPTAKEVVSGRFGKFRAGGADNSGSANTQPHMHDGIDFSTDNSSEPLYVTTAGTVVFADARGSAGNAVLIKRDNGDIVAYYHLSGFASGITKGATVTPGQLVGLSGNTNQGSGSNGQMAKHLHFVYGTSQRDDARAKAFPSNAAKGPFNPGQLPTEFNQQSGIGWKTDPAPYFCKTYPINDGHPEDASLLGADTKAQYAKLFGSVPNGGTPPNVQFDAGQVEAANQDTILAQSSGKTASTYLSDSDGYGSLPQPAIGGYDTMSIHEMLMTEAQRRFSSAEWNTNVTKVSSRALLVDYNRATGVSLALAKAVSDKKLRIEGLLATYVSLRMAHMREEVKAAHERAQRDAIGRAIQ